MISSKKIITDIDLISLIRNDDPNAFRLLYERHWKTLYVRACKNVGEDEAKDLIQEIMVSLWNRRNHINIVEEDDLIKYLFTALKYRTISYYTYETSQIKKSNFFEDSFEISPDALLEMKELTTIFDDTVNSMPEKMQQIFRMSREQEISIADIASQLNLSQQTVKNQITQALKRLRSVVLKYQMEDCLVPILIMLYTFNK